MPLQIPVTINTKKMEKAVKILSDVFILIIFPLILIGIIIFFVYRYLQKLDFGSAFFAGMFIIALIEYFIYFKKEYALFFRRYF